MATFGLKTGAIITGTVASDGSFTASSLQNASLPVLTISGHVPATAGSAWSGTYILISTNHVCPVNQSGPFTATPVRDLNGTYTSSGVLYGATNSATLSLTLSQGAPLYSSMGRRPAAAG